MAFIHSPFFTCIKNITIKNRKKATTFKLINCYNRIILRWYAVKQPSYQITQTYTKACCYYRNRILIRHYRLDKSIEAENMPPNSPDMNPADYSILENLSQRLYKHQRIRDMQHLKDLLEEKREELPQYKSDACINQFRYIVYLKLSK